MLINKLSVKINELFDNNEEIRYYKQLIIEKENRNKKVMFLLQNPSKDEENCKIYKICNKLLNKDKLISEILMRPGNSSKDEFASWLGSMNESDLQVILQDLRRSGDAARSELLIMQEERRAEQERIETLKKRMLDQQSAARNDRSLIVNTRTGKLEFKQ
jgi:aminopeptidase C